MHINKHALQVYSCLERENYWIIRNIGKNDKYEEEWFKGFYTVVPLPCHLWLLSHIYWNTNKIIYKTAAQGTSAAVHKEMKYKLDVIII